MTPTKLNEIVLRNGSEERNYLENFRYFSKTLAEELFVRRKAEFHSIEDHRKVAERSQDLARQTVELAHRAIDVHAEKITKAKWLEAWEGARQWAEEAYFNEKNLPGTSGLSTRFEEDFGGGPGEVDWLNAA